MPGTDHTRPILLAGSNRRTQAFTDGQGCRWLHPAAAARRRVHEKITLDTRLITMGLEALSIAESR